MSLMGFLASSSIWFFWVAELVAGTVAALAFSAIDPASRGIGKELTSTLDATTFKSEVHAR